MTIMAMKGEKSTPPILTGRMRLILLKTGSVASYIKRTMGLYGSGLTHEITALAMITHI
jgi:hypothetical protein